MLPILLINPYKWLMDTGSVHNDTTAEAQINSGPSVMGTLYDKPQCSPQAKFKPLWRACLAEHVATSKPFVISPFPHQRKICTEGLQGRRALCVLGRTMKPLYKDIAQGPKSCFPCTCSLNILRTSKRGQLLCKGQTAEFMLSPACPMFEGSTVLAGFKCNNMV